MIPGRCVGCGSAVSYKPLRRWSGRWLDADGRIHRCPTPRPARCGVLMRYAKEPCARRPGHQFEHRSEYALENARRMASGRRLALFHLDTAGRES